MLYPIRIMFCNKCGRPIEDDQLLCEQCAAAEETTSQSPTGVSTEEFTLNTAGVVSAKKPNKGLLVGAIIAGVAVLAVLVALLWGPISGLLGFDLKFDTPQEHFSYVEGKSVDMLTDSITASYGSFLSQAEKTEGAYEAEVHILVGDDLLTLLGTYLGTGEELDLSWLSDIMLKIDATGSTEIGQALLTLGLGDSEVVSADVILDISKMMVWLTIPELSSTYLEADLQTILDDSGMEYDPDYMAGMVEAMPSEQVVNELLEKYTDIVFSKITNVESKTETVTVGEISQECTALVATVDEKTLIEITIAVLEAAKEDEKLAGALEGIIRYTSAEEADSFAQEWEQTVSDALEEVRASLEEASAESYVQMIDYVDSKHNIIGRHITVSNTEEDIYYMTVQNGDTFAFEADILDTFAVTGNGTEKQEVVNAEYTLDVEGMELATIQLVDLDGKKLDSGNVSGTIRAVPSDALIQEIVGIGLDLNLALELVVDTGKSGENVALNLLMDEELFVGINAEVKQTDTTAVEAPTNTIDAMDEAELSEWVQGFSYDVLLDNLGKAGLPEELLDAVEQLVGMIEENTSI